MFVCKINLTNCRTLEILKHRNKHFVLQSVMYRTAKTPPCLISENCHCDPLGVIIGHMHTYIHRQTAPHPFSANTYYVRARGMYGTHWNANGTKMED